ncbi:hypothetical protein VTJ49DRAFT_317 [Mycothermus thermophilus]|uniref:Uncharacterized protein n=1 Tax=Humicola insolens TaxID=85995 RepID=A0ABR3VFF6_HUMIN
MKLSLVLLAAALGGEALASRGNRGDRGTMETKHWPNGKIKEVKFNGNDKGKGKGKGKGCGGPDDGSVICLFPTGDPEDGICAY